MEHTALFCFFFPSSYDLKKFGPKHTLHVSCTGTADGHLASVMYRYRACWAESAAVYHKPPSGQLAQAGMQVATADLSSNITRSSTAMVTEAVAWL